MNKKIKEGDQVFVYDLVNTIDGPQSVVYSKSFRVRSTTVDGDVIYITILRHGNMIGKYYKWYESVGDASQAAFEELNETVTEKRKIV